MILYIGKRVKVPYHADTQAIIVGINSTGAFTDAGLTAETHYSLRYLSDSGMVIDKTFLEADLRRDNPSPQEEASRAAANRSADLAGMRALIEREIADAKTQRNRKRSARKSKSKKRK